MIVKNPFTYGGPVEPAQFAGRDDMVDWLFTRLYSGQGTAIVGEPCIGKTSLLHYILEPRIREEWLEEESSQYAFVMMDCQQLGRSTNAVDYWSKILEEAEREFKHSPTSDLINKCIEKLRNGTPPESLLLNFSRLLAEIKDASFFSSMNWNYWSNIPTSRCWIFYLQRSLASTTRRLVLITASRTPIDDLEKDLEKAFGLANMPSPVFNICPPKILKPFESQQLEKLLDRALKGHDVTFSTQERTVILEKSNGHPYLAQCLAWFLFDQYARKRAGENPLEEALALFHCQVSRQSNFWPHLSGDAQRDVKAEKKPRAAGRDRCKIFICYSHEDKKPYLERVKTHLKVLAKERKKVDLDYWSDTDIRPGDKWRLEIEEALNSATIAVLLVSTDFLASDFIRTVELPRLLESESNRGLKIIPIIVAPCRYNNTEVLSQFEALNDPEHPLSTLEESEREKIFVQLTVVIDEFCSG